MQLYRIFLFIVITFKIIYILSSIHLKFYEKFMDKKSEFIKKTRLQNHIIYIISDTLMSLFLLYLFVPLNYGGINIRFGEKVSLFTLGIMNLLQMEWLEAFRFILKNLFITHTH
jgi:hypothetical protein